MITERRKLELRHALYRQLTDMIKSDLEGLTGNFNEAWNRCITLEDSEYVEGLLLGILDEYL